MLGFTLISGFDFFVFFSLRVLYDSTSRFFIDDSSREPKGFIINVEEHKNEKWIRHAKESKNNQHVKIRY